jgi:hypothetical protein
MIVFDSGYDLTRLAWLLRDLPVEVTGRLRSDRVMYFPAPPRPAGADGRPSRHGTAFRFDDQQSWPAPAVTTSTATQRYGNARACAWPRLHQKLARQRQWQDHPGPLPVIEGTVIRLQVEHLPDNRSPDPLWLRTSGTATTAGQVTRTWQVFLRRFAIEHTFRFLKHALGWTRPRLRDPAAAGRWTWLIIACYAQLYLARHLAADLRLPWQRPCPPGRLTPARVRRGSVTSARPCPVWPARRNPANQAPAARPARRTATRPPATTSAKPPDEPKPANPPQTRQVK